MIFIISGPSGTGKGIILRRVLEKDPGIRMSISCTTRPQRAGEVDGVDYHFISEVVFKQKIETGEFAEWEQPFGTHFYGTLLSELSGNDGKDIVLEIDVEGAMNIKAHLNHVHTIFILPPSPDELIRRVKLRARGETAAETEARIKTATGEVNSTLRCDYWIFNTVLDKAVADLTELIRILRILETSYRNRNLLGHVQRLFTHA